MSSTNKVDIGILCSEGLGDTLIQMVLAYNLAESGYYKVTFYSNYATILNNEIKGYHVQVLPKEPQAIEILASHHAFIFDQGSPHYRRFSEPTFKWVVNNGIGYKMSSGSPTKTQVSRSRLLSRINTCFDASLRSAEILSFNQTIREPSIGLCRKPMVSQIVWFLEHRVGLSNVTNDTGFELQGSVKQLQCNRVLIHPTSSRLNKNWPVNNYLQFAKLLERDGFNPVFTVSPKERQQWLKLVRGQFEVPLFESIYDLAVFYSESGWFVGNDSGNAHMASCVGIPTFQIFPRWRTSPSWRAGWGQNTVLTAKFPYCLSRSNWQAGLSVDKAYKRFTCWYQALHGTHHLNSVNS